MSRNSNLSVLSKPVLLVKTQSLTSAALVNACQPSNTRQPTSRKNKHDCIPHTRPCAARGHYHTSSGVIGTFCSTPHALAPARESQHPHPHS